MNGTNEKNVGLGNAGREAWILAASGLAALGPLVVFRTEFARLFWFGDDFDQVDFLDRNGIGHWVWTVFAENFMPVSKIAEGLILFGFRGSYFALIAAMWLVHAANTVLLGRLMRNAGLPWLAVWIAQIGFALTPASLETLGWGMQLSVVLACAFFLLGLVRCFPGAPDARTPSGRSVGAIFGLSLASAWSFSRGVLTGPVLAIACLWPGSGESAPSRRRPAMAAAALAPALVTAALIGRFSTGNHQHMHGHWSEAFVYAVWYYCLNPAYRLFSVESWGWHTVFFLGALKLALIVWAMLRSGGRQRLLMALLVAFDLGNAALLGIGRYHTGVETSISSRYQYTSLIGILPLGGYWVAWLVDRLPCGRQLRRAAAAIVVALAGYGVVRNWRPEIEIFTWSRGTESRRILLQEADPGPLAVPGIPFMTTVRARELIEKYNLH